MTGEDLGTAHEAPGDAADTGADATPRATGRPFAAGERVLLIDRKKRRHLITLEAGSEWHSHAGVLPHDSIIGGFDGALVQSSQGLRLHCIRPTLADFVLKMPRGAQVIYPKDLGPLLMLADIYPGVRVFESGVGSGALSMTMLRSGAEITGYELRDDFAARAQRNVESFLGEDASARYHVEVRSSYDGIDGDPFDRIVLDLPEPWEVVPHATTALLRGGIIVAYTPQITQAAQFRATLEEHGFGMGHTVEVLNRTWHIEGQAVRPDHRMVAHTGFLTSARLIS